jgi:hypothetical protein
MSPPAPVVNRTTRGQLLRLRQLLEEAQARAHDASPIGRHVALILLDGACENAMKVVLTAHGLAPKRSEDSFDQVYARVTACLPDWSGEGWAEVSNMHASRNLAQHRGATPDGDDMATWSAAVERFTRSLIHEAFAAEINDVVLADAISTDELRALLTRAEHAVRAGDPYQSMQLSVEAFDLARGEWSAQHATAVDQPTLTISPLGIAATDGATYAIHQLNDYTEVLPFVASLGEYIWFLARRDDLQRDVDRTIAEAQRLLRFVIDWVLRWEAFAKGYSGRHYPPQEPTAPLRTAAGDPPLIYATHVVSREEPGGQDIRDRMRYDITFELANMPETEAQSFAAFLREELAESVDFNHADAACRAHASVWPEGLIRFWAIETTASPTILNDRVQTAVRRATERHADLLRRQAAWASERQGILDSWVAGLQSVAFRDQRLFDGFDIDGIIDEHGKPVFTVKAEAQAMAGDDVAPFIWDVLNKAGVSVGTDIAWHVEGWSFAGSIGVDAAASKSREVAGALERRLTEETSKSNELAEAHRVFETALQAHLPGHS